MASYLPRTLIRGDTRQVNVTVRDTIGNPVDLTGCKVYFTLNLSASPTDDSSAPIAKSTTTHTDPTHGKTMILLTKADTDGVPPGVYYFDAQVRDAFGQPTSSSRGHITVQGDITRSTD